MRGGGEREQRFQTLFERVYVPLWSYARRRAAPADVEDVVAEILAIAWRRLDDVPEGEGELPWLYRVGRNVLANRNRADRRRLRLVERLSARAPREEDPGGEPVLEALASLRPDDREILRLAAWEGLAPREIAVVLGCSVNAATLRLSRARKKLRESLTESLGIRTQAGWKEIDA